MSYADAVVVTESDLIHTVPMDEVMRAKLNGIADEPLMPSDNATTTASSTQHTAYSAPIRERPLGRVDVGTTIIVTVNEESRPFVVVGDDGHLMSLRACGGWQTFPNGVGRRAKVSCDGRVKSFEVVGLSVTLVGGDLAGRQVTGLTLRHPAASVEMV